MKIIFLDIDGVLITNRSIRNKDIERKADPAAVRALNRIIAATDAQIVVSSTWRAHGPSKMLEFLTLWGVKGRIAGQTPDLSDQYGALWMSPGRTREISMWLRDYPGWGDWQMDQITGYVILDDDPIEKPLNGYHIQTTFDQGLSEIDAEEAIIRLGWPILSRTYY